jgi:hypothetical protein
VLGHGRTYFPSPRALSSSHEPTPLSVRAPTLELHEILQPFAAVGAGQAKDRAAAAIAKHPEKSDRAIAAELGIGSNTVRRVRQRTAPDGAVGKKRIGKDGKLPSNRLAHMSTVGRGSTIPPA